MKTVAMVPTYNEADIVSQVIEHLCSQGIQLVILDDGSSDGTYETCLSYVGKGVLSVERQFTAKLEWAELLQKLYRMALIYTPEWVVLSAADEFLESPYHGLSLKDAIELEARKGYNLLQFNNFEFWPTEKDCENLTEKDVRKRIKYYTWDNDFQFRSWKVYPDMRVDEGGSHVPSFPLGISANISPNKFVLRHYKIRSYEHGLRKVAERLSRYNMEERKLGWHMHYDNFGQDRTYFIIDSTKLTKYNDDQNWNLTKSFDGCFGTRLAPPTGPDTVLLQLTERLQELERQNAELNGSVALQIARKFPFGKHVRRFFVSKAKNPNHEK